MEKFLRIVLILSLVALAVLTPVWWLQEHRTPAPPESAAPPSPEPSADPTARAALRYEAILELYWAGDHAAALPLFDELGDYRESAELAEICREALYPQALEALYRRKLDSAAELLRLLGDYEDSARWLRWCEARLEWGAPAESLLSQIYYRPRNGRGTIYSCHDGLIYVPKEISADTKLVVYYPGGSVGTEKSLDSNVASDYAARFAPDAVCFFAYTCDYHRIEAKNREVWAVVEQLMQECSIVPHEVYLVGTSNGFYTAMQLAIWLLEEQELPVRALMSWDAGEDWHVEELLSAGELGRLAQAGTRMILLEQRNFDSGRRVIRDMLDAGLPVDLVECYNGDHQMITVNAFRYGVLSWALGERELDRDEYILHELKS